MTTDYAKLAYDKVSELEKRFLLSTNDGATVSYRLKTDEYSLVVDSAYLSASKNFKWNFITSEASKLKIEVSTPQKSAVTILLTYDGSTIFNGAMTTGTATMSRGGNVPVGDVAVSLSLNSSAAFTATVKVTVGGYFTDEVKQTKLATVGDEHFSLLSGGDFSIYDNSSITRLLTIYGVKNGGATKLANGDFLLALIYENGEGELLELSPLGEYVRAFVLPGDGYRSFSLRATTDGATIYAASGCRLKEIILNATDVTVYPSSIRCASVTFAQCSSANYLAIVNPTGYAYLYGVE